MKANSERYRWNPPYSPSVNGVYFKVIIKKTPLYKIEIAKLPNWIVRSNCKIDLWINFPISIHCGSLEKKWPGKIRSHFASLLPPFALLNNKLLTSIQSMFFCLSLLNDYEFSSIPLSFLVNLYFNQVSSLLILWNN